MSVDENKAMIKRVFQEAVSGGNLALIDQYFDWHPTEIKRNLAKVRQVFPDLHVTVEDMIGEANKLATRETWRGTHAETNEKVEGIVLHIFWIEGAKVVDEWSKGWDWLEPHLTL